LAPAKGKKIVPSIFINWY